MGSHWRCRNEKGYRPGVTLSYRETHPAHPAAIR
ncbi:hypothetical protein [Microbulbifer sp. HZ11]